MEKKKDKKSKAIETLLEVERTIAKKPIGRDEAYLLLTMYDNDIEFSGKGTTQKFFEMLHGAGGEKELIYPLALACALLLLTDDDFSSIINDLLEDNGEKLKDIINTFNDAKPLGKSDNLEMILSLANKTKS